MATLGKGPSKEQIMKEYKGLNQKAKELLWICEQGSCPADEGKLVKNGKLNNGKQRYKCTTCNYETAF